MRASGVRGLLIYCSDYQCSHWTAISSDPWPDDARLSDIEPRFTCQACGQRGADVRPNFHWEKEARALAELDETAWCVIRDTNSSLQKLPNSRALVPWGRWKRDGTRLLRPQATAA